MHSMLIIHKNPAVSLEEAQKIIKNYTIHHHDVFTLDPSLDKQGKKTESTSIGIEVINKMKETLYLKPSQSPAKAVIIQKAHLLTIPAQNALLKVLEEPPNATYIFLIGQTEDALLPTILSRCQILRVDEERETLSDEVKETITKEYYAFSSLSLAALLKKADMLSKNKAEAQEYLTTLTTVIREEMLHDVDKPKEMISHLSFLQSVIETQRTIQLTNSNLRLTLEHLLLKAKQ